MYIIYIIWLVLLVTMRKMLLILKTLYMQDSEHIEHDFFEMELGAFKRQWMVVGGFSPLMWRVQGWWFMNPYTVIHPAKSPDLKSRILGGTLLIIPSQDFQNFGFLDFLGVIVNKHLYFTNNLCMILRW